MSWVIFAFSSVEGKERVVRSSVLTKSCIVVCSTLQEKWLRIDAALDPMAPLWQVSSYPTSPVSRALGLTESNLFSCIPIQAKKIFSNNAASTTHLHRVSWKKTHESHGYGEWRNHVFVRSSDSYIELGQLRKGKNAWIHQFTIWIFPWLHRMCGSRRDETGLSTDERIFLCMWVVCAPWKMLYIYRSSTIFIEIVARCVRKTNYDPLNLTVITAILP